MTEYLTNLMIIFNMIISPVRRGVPRTAAAGGDAKGEVPREDSGASGDCKGGCCQAAVVSEKERRNSGTSSS